MSKHRKRRWSLRRIQAAVARFLVGAPRENKYPEGVQFRG